MCDQTSDPTLAAEVCCNLISSYLAGHEAVKWSDVQDALNAALKAFDLPETPIAELEERDR
ncbi:hypothetical protein AS026_29155 [Rhizobium altiplani]|uniref:Uncharacterized protein n=1 Tax=Rhizobium altiplani TaxID=1864509 RepID=A0A109K1P2_9HYPH|nr:MULTISPECIES: hypothetical protein [Rhizobium]KWV59172.1 hypothetical protein AS026_29155 [Rhizobium altiplani]